MAKLKDDLARAKIGVEKKTAHRDTAYEAAQRQAALEKMFVDSCAIDLAFVSDATGSMSSWIEAVAGQVLAIASDVTKRYGVGGVARQVSRLCSWGQLLIECSSSHKHDDNIIDYACCVAQHNNRLAHQFKNPLAYNHRLLACMLWNV